MTLLFLVVAGGRLADGAGAGELPPQAAVVPSSLVETAPSLAPFQHVRFCLRYPADCRPDLTGQGRIDLTDERSDLLDRVNHRVNAAIGPVEKSYTDSVHEGWRIAPLMGDCNDYAVTKRHELLQRGLSAKALRLAVVKTKSEGGHLVLLVATTKGDLVLDNLSDTIVPWQNTDYHWLKLQSATDPRIWHEVKVPRASPESDGKLRVVERPASKR
ncbi:MAG: transglutaminase-like cysteine peptidase [Bradyrhizobium sp.]|nr:transglutaminase-like cysteine peptidase [Bradyrhizobium sp.]